MSQKARILVVDDEANARQALKTLLEEEGFEVGEAADGQEALDRMSELQPDIVLSDVRMPRLDGIGLVKAAKAQGSQSLFIMMTAFATIGVAVEAMRAGAENFVVKPLDLNAVLVMIEKALEKVALKRDAQILRERIRERYRFPGIIGDSAQLHSVFEVVKRAAPTKATVLLLGESGTGKELVAQAIHEESDRKDKPFVKVACAALSEKIGRAHV